MVPTYKSVPRRCILLSRLLEEHGILAFDWLRIRKTKPKQRLGSEDILPVILELRKGINRSKRFTHLGASSYVLGPLPALALREKILFAKHKSSVRWSLDLSRAYWRS